MNAPVMNGRSAWPDKLSVLVAPDRPAEAAEALRKIATLLGDMPDRCFTTRSALEAVATCKRRTTIPAYGDIRNAMIAWIRDNPEQHTGGGRPSDWSPEEHAWADYWFTREGEGFKRISDHADPRANLVSLLHQQAPKVAAWLGSYR